MPFFHVQDDPYTPAHEYLQLAGNISLRGDIEPIPFDKSQIAELDGDLNLSGTLNPYSSFEAGFDGLINLRGDIEPDIVTKNIFLELDGAINLRGTIAPDVVLHLAEPEPILNELSPTAFQNSTYFVRAKKGANELKIKGFTISAPKGAIGKTVNLDLATKEKADIPKDATDYKFELGKAAKPFDTPLWTTIISNANLDTRSYSMRWLGDTLSFGAVSPLSDKLNRCPKKNLILYDGNKIQVSTDEVEPIPDTLGNQILTDTENVAGLTLYYALNKAFVFGCGFASVKTNIPNYEISRADFLITGSWLDGVRGFLGRFEPLFFVVGNILWIVDKTQAIPDGFAPVSITPNRFLNWQQSVSSAPLIDGFVLTFSESSLYADYYTERTETPPPTNSGNFGSDNFTETTITRTYRDYRHSDNPDVVVKTELRREVRETRGSSIVITNRDIEDYFYDSQGKRIETRKTSEKLMPDLPSSELSLQLVREEVQEFFYKADKFNPKKQVQEKVVTRISGLISVDSNNQYLGADFKQDFIEAHKAGSLEEGQTTEFGSIKTVIETFEQLGNGQLQRRVEGINHLRNLPITSSPEIVLAENSVNSIGGKQKKIILWKTGLTPTNRTGNPLEVFYLGEIPHKFGLPLAERSLERRGLKKEFGSIELLGWDESLERGTYFAVLDRNDAIIGIFICEGYTVTGTDLGTPQQRIATTIEVIEV